jgi:hypothetical protein
LSRLEHNAPCFQPPSHSTHGSGMACAAHNVFESPRHPAPDHSRNHYNPSSPMRFARRLATHDRSLLRLMLYLRKPPFLTDQRAASRSIEPLDGGWLNPATSGNVHLRADEGMSVRRRARDRRASALPRTMLNDRIRDRSAVRFRPPARSIDPLAADRPPAAVSLNRCAAERHLR